MEEAGDYWIKTGEASGLERTTLTGYKRDLRMHIAPRIGRLKPSQLSAPTVRDFEDKLRQGGMSPAMVRKVRWSLSMILADALERGFVNRNVARELRRSKERKAEKRHKGKLKVGVDIPTPDEIRTIIPCLYRWRPFFLTAIFCGLRASELRGLRWPDISFEAKELHVRQRADCYNVIGRPEERGRRADGPDPAAGAECPSGMEAAMSQGAR